MKIYLDDQKLIEKYKADNKIESCTFDFSDDFDYSEIFIDDIMSPDWPEAVDPLSIVQTDEDKFIRAEAILELYVKDNLSGLKFLDFGCGSGEVAEVAANSASVSVGYDIVKDAAWDNHKKAKLTTDWEEVKKLGPYDIILCYDVFDHYVKQEDKNIKLKNICKNKIFVRFHPYISIHGNHLYKRLNKGYAHLFLTENFMQKNNYLNIKTNFSLNPEIYYNVFVKMMELKEVSKNILYSSDNFSLFFSKNKKLENFLLHKIKDLHSIKIEFVDYILST